MKKIILLIIGLTIGSLSLAQQKTANTNWIEADSLGGSIQLPSWFKESFLEIELDVEEAREANKMLLLYFHQEGCPYCKAMIQKNFLEPTTEQFLQENFDVVEINIRGSRVVTTPTGDQLNERDFAKTLKIQYTPTILILDQSDLDEPKSRINGFRPLPVFQQTLLQVTGKSGPFEQTLITEPKLIQQSFFNPTRNLHQGIEQKPIAIFLEKQNCPLCQQMHGEAFANPETMKILDNWLNVQIDVEKRQEELTLPSGEQVTVGDWVDQLSLDFFPTVLLYAKGEKEETFRIDSYLRSFHVQNALSYIDSGEYLTEPEFQRYIDASMAKRRLDRAQQ